jgi:hypothetical protein
MRRMSLKAFAPAQGRKLGQPDIDAPHLSQAKQSLRELDDIRETGVPVAKPISLERKHFDLALKGAMQLELNVVDLGELQSVII